MATQRQLIDAGLASEADPPGPPWHRIQGTGDASTLWYAVMRKATRGIYIGTLCMRHSDHHERLAADGWEEVPPDQIAPPG